MAQEQHYHYADTQHPAPFPGPDGTPWDPAVAQHGGSVGPAPGSQPGGYYDYDYDPEALAAYACAVAVPPGPGCYALDLGAHAHTHTHTPVEPEVAFDHYASVDADVHAAHPSSAFGYLHYLPPAAISKKYYALQDPNVYPTDSARGTSSPSASSSYALPPPQTPFEASSSSPSTIDTYYADATADVPTIPSPSAPEFELEAAGGAIQVQPTAVVAPPPSPLDPLATPTPTLTPSSAYFEDFRFAPHEGWHPTHAPSGPPERAHPVLPKQRRNRDDPGGDAGRLAQVAAHALGVEPQEAQGDRTGGVGFQDAYYGAQGLNYAYPDAVAGQVSMQQEQAQKHGHQQEQEPVVVPSQWKLGAVLDRLRFPQFGGDWDALMAAVHGEPYRARMPRSHSPLSAEELAQLEQLRVGFGLGLSAVPAYRHPTTPMTPVTPTTPATGGYNTMNNDADEIEKIVVYSPMTGRRIPVTAGPSGPVLQLGAVPPGARRTHRRGVVAACAFCRRRKIACGGPKEGDEARRCGQCIQRQQPCEFPGTSYQHAHPVPLTAPPYGYAHPAHRVGDAPR